MKIDIKSIPCFVIVVKDNLVSESYAKYITPLWQDIGIQPQRFDAITPSTLPSYLSFTYVLASKYTEKGIAKTHTPTEQAVWYSHVELWQLCADMDQPILVLEHDAIPVNPELLDVLSDVDYQTFDRGAMGCYVITPKFALWMVDFLTRRHGVVDTGPGSMITWVQRDWTPYLNDSNIDIVTALDSRYRPACTQVYDPKVGTVIDHYTGTAAEGMAFKLFPHYIEVDLGIT